jgi:hypothetical protein
MTESSEWLARDEDGWTVLDWAAGRGDLPEVQRLLEAGADPGAATPDGRTPQEIALAAGHLGVARLLRAAEQAAGHEPAGHGWRPYCRAYLLGDLRRFQGWQEPQAGPGQELADDTVVFLHDDFTVTRAAWPAGDVLFAGDSDGDSGRWAAYCRSALDFAVPDDFDLAPPPAGESVAAG